MSSAWRSVKASPGLREIRLHLASCVPESTTTPPAAVSASKGVKEFISKYYPAIKQDNPQLPFLIRQAPSASAILYARYDFGKETSVPLDHLSCKEVEGKVRQILAADE